MTSILSIVFYVLLAVVSLLGFLIWTKRAKNISTSPGPPWTPILGNSLDIIKNKDRYHDWLLSQTRKFKRPWRLALFNAEANLQLSGDPAQVQHILKDQFRNYVLPLRRIELLRELLGDGIFASNGDTWRLHRKAASHIFTLRNLRDYMCQVLESHAKTFIKLLNTKCIQEGEEGKAVESRIEMQTLYFRYTMDSFSEIAFGESTDSLTEDTHPFSTAFDRAQRLLLDRFFDPFYRVKKLFGLGREKQIKADINTLNTYAKKVIAKRRADEKEGKKQNDLISQFLSMAAATQEQLTDKQLRDIVINFMLAGRDTTACALTWLTYELTQHPEVEKRILDEIQMVFGGDWEKEKKDGGFERESDYYYHRVNQLEYTEATVLECLRLHPPVAGDSREALQADTLPDGTKVPKGALVAFNPWQHNRSLQYWGDDAETFNPNRWLDDNGKRKEISPFAYPTFSAGPRICLGKGLALLEVKLLLSLLLPRFHFKLADKSYVPHYVMSIVLSLKPPGLPLHVYRRNLLKGPPEIS